MTLLVGSTAFTAEGPTRIKKGSSTSNPAGTPQYSILNINNLWTWFRTDGQSNHSPQGDDGTYYPRGTRWVIYQDGFMWGGKALNSSVRTDTNRRQTIRVGGQTYNVGTKSGWINGTGANATAVSTADPRARMWRIRRDYKKLSDSEVARDAGEVNEKLLSEVTGADKAAVLAQYETDWNQWPVDLGAPYIERNGQPGFQRPPAFSATFTVDSLISGNYDEPGVAGSDPKSPADQVVWTVFNDLDETASLGLYGSYPLGLEIQMTLWGYKRTDAMGNLYFKRYKFINKGGVDVSATGTGQKGSFWIDSMFVAQWSDPDLGAFGDDLCGVDTTIERGKNKSLGYVYNGNAIDSEFRKFSLPPPSVGYDFLQGPIIPATASDTAVFDLKYRRGWKNLPLTSFAYFSAGSGISDPPFSREGGLRWWRMLQGFVPDPSSNPYRLYSFPTGEPTSKFPLAGDPVTRRGVIDGLGQTWSLLPGDRRIVLNSGPFTLAPGDTQEIVVGTVAGIGSDRLSSISVMKFNDRFVQNTYDALFQVPKAPQAPDVKIAELDGQIVLEWGSNLQRVNETETTVNQPGAYRFEGYNIYQLPSSSSSLSDAVRIATYDLLTDPTVILDEQFDQRSGQILSLPVQFGTNSDIKRFFNVTRDYVRDIDRLYNGQEYYFAVTAYSRATVAGFLPAALESDVIVQRARARVPFGTTYKTKYGDTLKVKKISGVSDGIVRPIIIDPTKSNGATYRVSFDTAGGNTTWRLTNVTANTTLTSGETNQSGDENYSFREGGILLKVEGPPPGLKRLDTFDGVPESQWGWKWTGSRFLTWASGDGLGFEGFRGAAGWASPRSVFGSPPVMLVPATQLKKIEIRFAATTNNQGAFDPNDPNASYAYRHGRAFTAAPARPEFATWMINRTGSGYIYQDYRISAPLAAYDVDVNPPRRLAIGYLENNVAGGAVNGFYWPPLTGTDNVASTGPREWLWISDDTYTGATPNPVYQNDPISGNQRYMYFCTWARRNDNPWPTGNVLELIPNRPNTPQDVFEYSLPAPETGKALEKASADKVGVFPNPYYAFNPAETNRLVRFVTFNNLPAKAKLRIFNLAGQLVRTLEKDDASTQFFRWDLNNEDNFPVASGMYIVHIEMTLPADGSIATKVLKVAIIQEQEVPDVF
jgi:hypothetical protein